MALYGLTLGEHCVDLFLWHDATYVFNFNSISINWHNVHEKSGLVAFFLGFHIFLNMLYKFRD